MRLRVSSCPANCKAVLRGRSSKRPKSPLLTVEANWSKPREKASHKAKAMRRKRPNPTNASVHAS